jgi:N-methylhydantoinase B
VVLARPIFDDEGLVAVCAARTHWVDVGGVAMGSWPVGGTVETIHQETSLRLPPMLLYRQGRPVKSTHSLILDATRAPLLVMGDMSAQHTANLTGEREILALVRRYGRAALFSAMDYALDYGEARMRAALRAVPDGEYEAEDWLDDDGVEDEPVRVRCRLTVRGDSAELDFSGTSRQTAGNSSTPWAMAASCAHLSLMSLLDPTIPSNGGSLRPIDMVLPPGTLVHALPFHACADGNATAGSRIFSVVLKVVGLALPERAAGDFTSSSSMATFAGLEDPRPGRAGMPWIHWMAVFSGWGATPRSDGHSYSLVPLSNCVDPPIEAIEQDAPVLVIQREFTPDSGGPGEHRGGLGTTYELGLLAPAMASSSCDRVRRAGFGACGGRASHRTYVYETQGLARAARGEPDPDAGALIGLFRDGEGVRFRTGKFFGHRIAAGRTWRSHHPGGGGWGDPLRRDPERVLADVRAGLVTRSGAERDYGVVIGDALDVDAEATAALRRALARDAEFRARIGPARYEAAPLGDRAPD